MMSEASPCEIQAKVDGITADEDETLTDVLSREIPPNASDPKAVDSLIASQMAELTVDDREKVYMDVHGIVDYILETPELIEESLVSLELEIQLIPDKKAYELAEILNPSYVHNPDFCLAFLRCEMFDCPKAALRIIRHFHIKLDLFGKDKLAIDITQDDFDLDDMDALYGSGGRLLNSFDSGGRVIGFIDGGVPTVYRTDVALRRCFYNIMRSCRGVEVQRRGGVTVCWGAGDAKGTISDNSDLNAKLPKVNEACPLRVSAVHMCITDETWKDRVALMRAAMAKTVKVRSRVHFGTVQECFSNLRSHGIDPSSIPVNEKGEVVNQLEHAQILQQERKLERLRYPPRKTIGVPSSQDVLLGKGTPFQNHPGNKILRLLVAERYKDYEKALKGAKKQIAEDVIANIRDSGGLFIKQEGGKWVTADHVTVVKKVSAAFRTLRLSGGIN